MSFFSDNSSQQNITELTPSQAYSIFLVPSDLTYTNILNKNNIHSYYNQ